jgi:hypothetical protein
MRFRLLSARLALAALALAALMAAGAVGGVRLGLIPYQSGLMLMVPATAIGLIALVCALAWLSSALKHNEGSGRRSGLIALAGSLAFLWPPLHALYGSVTLPPVHDVTSDPDDPPQFVALAKLRQPGMNSPRFDKSRRVTFRGETGTVGYILKENYRDITKPHAVLLMTTAKAFWRNFEAVKGMGWTIVDYSEKEGRIEATAPSFWFGQVSDIVIRVEKAGEMGARLDVRAQGESGDRDFGRNLELVRDYFRRLSR